LSSSSCRLRSYDPDHAAHGALAGGAHSTQAVLEREMISIVAGGRRNK
jgi:hypothetical protein